MQRLSVKTDEIKRTFKNCKEILFVKIYNISVTKIMSPCDFPFLFYFEFK